MHPQLSRGARRRVARPHIPLSMRLDTVIVGPRGSEAHSQVLVSEPEHGPPTVQHALSGLIYRAAAGGSQQVDQSDHAGPGVTQPRRRMEEPRAELRVGGALSQRA